MLFADLVGFTPYSEGRDPEEARELLSRYFDTARTVVSRYGGVVEKFIGDAVMAVWGAPVAVEGDTERTVRAGLDLVDQVAGLSSELGIPGLAARAGVTTGDVAVNVGVVGEGMVAGDAVNTAARIQAVAAPGEVWVDEATRRLAEAAVGFENRGEHQLKGKTEPLGLWRATRVLAGVGGAQRIDGLEAPLLGRDAELRAVKALFHATEQRRTPRLVLVAGPVGVGKSRLGWEFEKYVDGLRETVLWHRGRCLPYGEGVAFWALAEIVRQRFGIAEDDPVEIAANKLSESLPRLVPDPAERTYIGACVSRLLGVPVSDDPAKQFSAEELFAGWRLFFERLAADHPVVLLVEDAQYADPGLLDFLDHLIDWARDVPIFVLVFPRPELLAARPGFGTGRNRSTLALDPLDRRSMDELLEALVPGTPDRVRDQLAGRAQGNPLFAVETIRSLVDRDIVVPREGRYQLVGDPGDLAVPDSLRGLLASRLDALGEQLRALVAHASVLGSTFEEEALAAISGRRVVDLRPGLSELVRREVLTIVADPLSPQKGSYAFGQDMLRQVAYETLSRRDRKIRHLAVAEYLRSAYPNDGEEVSDVIAQHYIDALTTVPDAPDTEQLRQDAITGLIRSGQRSTRAGATRSASLAYSRAADIAEAATTIATEQIAEWWEKAAENDMLAADFEAAAARANRAALFFDRAGHPRSAARCRSTMAGAQGLLGRHTEARQTLHSAIAVLRPDPDADTIRALTELAELEVIDGTSDGESATLEALALAQAIDVDEDLLAELFSCLGMAHLSRHRTHEALAAYGYAAQLAEHSNYKHWGSVLSNLADALLPTDPGRAADVARMACEKARRAGDRGSLSYALGNLAVALIEMGRWEEAQGVLGRQVEADHLADSELVQSYRCFLAALRGEVPSAEGNAKLPGMRASEDPQDLASVAMCDAFLAEAEGRTSAALVHARTILEHLDSLGVRHECVRWGWPLAARLALTLGEAPTVEELLNVLDAHPDGHLPPILRAERELVRAQLLATRGSHDADASFTRALAALHEVGSPYHLADGLLDYAVFLTATGQPDQVRSLLEQVNEIAQRLGCMPIISRLSTLESKHPSDLGRVPTPDPLGPPDPLRRALTPEG